MKKKSNCRKTSEAYVKTRRNKAFGAMATAGAALLALNLSTDANAAIVSGTDFWVGDWGPGTFVNSPTIGAGGSLGAFNDRVNWGIGSYFGWKDGKPANIILTASGPCNNLKLLSSGYLISAGRSFNDYGYWTGLGGQSGYIGVEFGVNNKYYGWIEVSINAAGDTLTLHSWAYEDEAGKAIAAGDTGSPVPIPGSLALLASGAAGLAALRRRKAAAA
ncbi:hypothetical protein DSCO28_71090 [Desulfosarcina ovata subsp. sediminis]|uniref:PEP-CTERM protein-sorting domain-containing protein n=1 Tax=Desulfosarcina ovata subsp. sediminis TaxID=885957 RepID=A0A5K8A1W5_9BACT|nr:hypothetical protein [Desulfosarcina ovata]BBO86543.1 hypothetical protein DSCO28_71090 [Desulfosarcina ovata subsp. sediminis]